MINRANPAPWRRADGADTSWKRRVRYNSRSRGDRMVGTKAGSEHGLLHAKEAAWHTEHILVFTGRGCEEGVPRRYCSAEVCKLLAALQ